MRPQVSEMLEQGNVLRVGDKLLLLVGCDDFLAASGQLLVCPIEPCRDGHVLHEEVEVIPPGEVLKAHGRGPASWRRDWLPDPGPRPCAMLEHVRAVPAEVLASPAPDGLGCELAGWVEPGEMESIRRLLASLF